MHMRVDTLLEVDVEAPRGWWLANVSTSLYELIASFSCNGRESHRIAHAKSVQHARMSLVSPSLSRTKKSMKSI